jgi:hypothetical protein
MQSRRSLRLVAGALGLAVPLLGSCGFDKATDRVYTPAAGTNDRDGDVDVLAAVIVAAQPDSGTFIASLSNNLSDKDFTLTGVTGAGDSASLAIAPSDLSIKIPARGFVNLADEDPITVSGDFDAGQFEQLTLSFDSGDTVTMRVPVVYACNYYEGLDNSASQASESASPTESPSPGDVPTDGTASPSATSSESASGDASASASSSAAAPYDCVAVGEG